MLVTQDASAGSIGGGQLELEAFAIARDLIAKSGGGGMRPMLSHSRPQSEIGQAPQLSKHFSLGPSLGQCCGGAVDLDFEIVDDFMLSAWADDTMRFNVALFGAGHVGRALANALAPLPCRLIWIDEREQEFAKIGPSSNAEVRLVDAPSAEIKSLPLQCYVIIATHSHALDLELCETALSRPDFAFIGLIGSATKKARFLKRLEQKNVRMLERLVCPIGLPSIQGKEPQVIAASVAAQLLSLSSVVKPERLGKKVKGHEA
jgi:xanthine dehydrogenase accessory factor